MECFNCSFLKYYLVNCCFSYVNTLFFGKVFIKHMESFPTNRNTFQLNENLLDPVVIRKHGSRIKLFKIIYISKSHLVDKLKDFYL